MNARAWFATAFFAAACLALTANVSAEERIIDTQKSVMTVHVYKTGVFSAFAHDHAIAAPIADGSADTAAHRVELRANASALRVSDKKGSEKDHGEIQQTMLGPEVLDVKRYPGIVFRSTSVEPAGQGSWSVHGNLALHGQTRPVTVTVGERAGHYVGSTLLKQTDFGIKPVRIAGGAIKVKDEIRIEFDVQLAH